ncbi:hypothetical protein [Phytohabitans houttuyneae]|uniref:N-acetyltransferase domain-containing protein n=1 Tax=Phytohabitans houttuyneae TaxID=1076126 RepID=A0A6V8KIU2_9ACTN|nr:hypothetical protein [Phytohabitans houttuyneae]GFJ82049.1 hypothetical protein Phou_062290 [Phytohabitans houttuyneae]
MNYAADDHARDRCDGSGARPTSAVVEGAARRGLVRAAPAGVVTRVEGLLAGAYASTALAGWLVPNQRSRAPLIQAWIGLCLEAAFERGHVDMPPGHRVATVWLPGPTTVGSNWWERLARATAPFADQFVNLHRRLADAAPTGLPYQQLAFAAGQNGIQGQGWGTLLLRRRLDVLDARQVPAYAVAVDPNSVRWLSRHGFGAHGPPIALPAHGRSAVGGREPPPRLGVTLQPLWRPPSKPQRRGP